MSQVSRAFFAIFIFCGTVLFSDSSQADVRLTPGHSYGVVSNANRVLLDLAVRTAIDDEWVESLRNMTAETSGNVDRAQVMVIFEGIRERLNRLGADAELLEIAPFADNAAENNATLYVAAGKILDALVQIIYANDNLAMIANYYLPDPADDGRDLAAIITEAQLLTMRLDAYIEENEL